MKVRRLKTKISIVLLIVVIAVSARTTGGVYALRHELADAASASVMSLPYDTLNREVYSRIPAKPKSSRKVVPVMSVPKSGEFGVDEDDEDDDYYDDDYSQQSEEPKRRLTNMTDREWIVDLQARVDSVARKSRSYVKTYTTTTGRGRRKKTVKHTKTVEQTFTMGCCVFDLTADSVIYSYDADKLMKPASTQKLFTAVSFLASKGYKYEFKTTVTTNGQILKDDNDRKYLKGDIYIKGSYDPTLDRTQVQQIARAIERLDIDSIDGLIVADIHRKGSISLGGSTARSAEMNFASTVTKELKKDSVCFSSSMPWGTTTSPTNGKHEIITISNPLAPVLQRMLKRSSNEYAEAILRNICNDDSNWSYDNCCNAVMKTVKGLRGPKKKGVAAKDYSQYYRIIDGSGLSHSNRVSAETEVMLLRYAYHNSSIYKPLYANLPIAGVDGTISKRMMKDATYNNVHAKTGTINEVSTLAGYVTAANGHQLAFAILVNETANSTGHSIQDDICLELAR